MFLCMYFIFFYPFPYCCSLCQRCKCWCGPFYFVPHSKLQLNCYFITTFNKNQQVHESARKELVLRAEDSRAPLLLLFLSLLSFFFPPPLVLRCYVCPALARTNGAWFCGSMRFILSIGIKIKMLVICLGFYLVAVLVAVAVALRFLSLFLLTDIADVEREGILYYTIPYALEPSRLKPR